MKSSIIVLKEQIKNFHLLRRLSWYEIKSQTSGNYLGAAWEIINPAIQIMIYWFVFGFGIRQREPIGDVEYFQWLFAGILVWFFLNQGLMKATRSIYQKIRMLSKMNFPMSVIPNYIVVSQFYPHLFLLVIGIIILQFMGYPISIYYLQLPIYTAAAVALLFSLSLITSTLATIVRDVAMMLQATMRMLLYLSPILWPPTLLPESWQPWLKLNPFYYIIEGYRNTLLGQSWYFLENPMYTLYFFGLLLVLFIIGSYLHVKFRSQFIDFL
jgi:teichoic acid transport system permease protein